MKRLIKKIIEKYIGPVLNTQKHQEEIDTLFYFLNQYVDITKIPHAQGALRDLQLLDAKFLKVIDLIMQKNNLTYVLAYGTLLGGIRHKGFIPWDDDLDLFMPRKDFEAAKNILKEDGEKLKFKCYINPNRWFESIGIRYTSGIWIDIFPLDTFMGGCNYDTVQHEYAKAIMEVPVADSTTLAWDEYVKRCNMLINQHVTSGNIQYYYRTTAKVPISENNLFPIKKDLFEDFKVSYPQNSDILLKSLYGDYMSFPHGGICLHGTEKCVNEITKIETNEYLNALIEKLTSDIDEK